jgi:hypothetical protein
MIVWRRRIKQHPVWIYSFMTVGVGCIFVHNLLTTPQSLLTALAGIWLLFVGLALWIHIDSGSTQDSK